MKTHEPYNFKDFIGCLINMNSNQLDTKQELAKLLKISLTLVLCWLCDSYPTLLRYYFKDDIVYY